MTADAGQRVVEVLEAEGPALPLVVLARRLGMRPSRLVGVLDDLYDAGRVTPGRERGTVALASGSREADGRFHQGAPARSPR